LNLGAYANLNIKNALNDRIQIDELFCLCSTTTWLEFKLNQNVPLVHEKKWAWIGSITLKSKIPLKLEKLNLQWFGEKIKDLQASLYCKKEKAPALIPIEKNLVCDGVWSTQNQELTFNINQKIVSVNNYYLLLSFPNAEEHSIKSGFFALHDKKAIQLTKLN
jgi:hypothetical protein